MFSKGKLNAKCIITQKTMLQTTMF